MIIIPDDVHVIYATIENGLLTYSSGNPMYHRDEAIEINFNDFSKYCFDNHLVGSWGDTNITEVPEMIEAFIQSKIAERREK